MSTTTTAHTFTHARLRTRRGLSLVEVMISLAIASMLLTAIAAAFHSSTQVITENDEFFRATQAARVSLNQMLTEVRRADAVAAPDNKGNDILQQPLDPTKPPFPIRQISAGRLPVCRPLVEQSSMEFMRYYCYDATAHKLMLYFQDANGTYIPAPPDSGVPGYTVASNVQAAPFSWDTALDKDGNPYVTRVSIALEVAVGNNRIRISGSAVPRRSIKYE